MTISSASRQRIRERANFLCEYCHSSEEASGSLFTFDHLLPQSLGGSDSENNLALAYHRCNSRRYNFINGLDPATQIVIPLFNPRNNRWYELLFSLRTDRKFWASLLLDEPLLNVWI